MGVNFSTVTHHGAASRGDVQSTSTEVKILEEYFERLVEATSSFVEGFADLGLARSLIQASVHDRVVLDRHRSREDKARDLLHAIISTVKVDRTRFSDVLNVLKDTLLKDGAGGTNFLVAEVEKA